MPGKLLLDQIQFLINLISHKAGLDSTGVHPARLHIIETGFVFPTFDIEDIVCIQCGLSVRERKCDLRQPHFLRDGVHAFRDGSVQCVLHDVAHCVNLESF